MYFNIEYSKNFLDQSTITRINLWREYYFFNFYEVNETNVEYVTLHRAYLKDMTPHEIFTSLQLLSSNKGLELINKLRNRTNTGPVSLPSGPLHASINEGYPICHVTIEEWLDAFKTALGVQFLNYVITEDFTLERLLINKPELPSILLGNFANVLLGKTELPASLYDFESSLIRFLSTYIPSLKYSPVKVKLARKNLAFAIKLVANKKELTTRPGFQFELF